MDVTKTDICDRDGNLLFYTNGYTIMNRLHEVMENGAGLSPGIFTNDWLPYGQTLHQGALFLPVPDVDSLYILIHPRQEYLPQMNQYGQVHSNWPLHYSTIELSQQYPDGRVTEKNVVLYEGQVTFGQVAACRHANGRDWWILVFKYFSNEYLRYLLHPGGITTYPPGSVGQLRPSGVGQAVFSPDGTKYARLNLDGFAINKQHIDVYDFDRCTGMLSNPILFHPLHVSSNGGMAISPNSRYLYFLGWSKIYQYDLNAPNIESSATLIAEYVEQPGVQRFSGGQLAPDGKIYISGASSSSYIHVIHNPNAAGAACEFEQGGLFLGAQARNGRGITSHAYYGLGPWDGSPCDTLGIDHHPQAAFRHREQSGTVGFWDYSLFFPTQWAWDFGDGSAGSTEQNPVHTYAAPGEYVVCLTASNANASSTWCDTVRVEVVSSAGEVGQERVDVRVFPNPASNSFTIAYSLAQPAEMRLYDIHGKMKVSRILPAIQAGREEIPVQQLSPGIYVVVVLTESGERFTTRLSIMR
ncbi:MAG TPA: PKD domain-containing protein, partial [Saprospiraceae bacterium]|nr:PKD domain-containing protein [Saprospiraceae bacterium]